MNHNFGYFCQLPLILHIDYYSFYEAVRKEYLDSLIPWVDANYETQTKQSGRAFGGLSLGGGKFRHCRHWCNTALIMIDPQA